MFVLADCLASLSLVCADDHNHGEEVEVEQETQLQTHHVILSTEQGDRDREESHPADVTQTAVVTCHRVSQTRHKYFYWQVN